jgi:hypothetical protein
LNITGSLKLWLLQHRKKIAEIGIGIFLYEGVFNPLYDFVFYPFCLAYWGLKIGGIVAVGGSLAHVAFLFWLYDHMKIDWLGAHALRQLDESENKGNLAKLAVWIGKEKHGWEKVASPFVFVLLTLPIDPLIVAVHYRKQHFQGIGLKDWGILVASVASANAWWFIKIGVVVEFGKFLWSYIH